MNLVLNQFKPMINSRFEKESNAGKIQYENNNAYRKYL